jgi:3-(3-hydroxy-phenyl)propionate hydroxylase
MSPPSRGFDLFREAALSLAETHRDIAKLINPRQTQAITYVGSSLSSASDAFSAGPPPGAALDDLPTQGAAGYLCDALGVGFTCLVFAPSRELPAAVAAFAAENRATVTLVRIARGPISDGIATLIDADGAVAGAYDASQGAVYLIRPDGHVAGRWRDPELPILQRALVTACGAPALIAEQLA